MKYVFVTGGRLSGLEKGVTASSIGVLLKACGLRVTSIKIDPYLNTDAGTMSPFDHGEVFFLDGGGDSGEVDLDLRNYERFLDVKLTRDHNITTGKVYQSVIDKERRGDYLGKTVQVVPHITDAIQEWIERVAKIPVDGQDGPPDVCVIELGGTIGDIESMPFIEATRQFSYRVGPGNFCLIHASLVPVLNVVGEQPKTKPTQHSVRGRVAWAWPLICWLVEPLDENVKAKLSQFCHVPSDSIITLFDVPNIWHIPLLLRDQKAHEGILKVLNLHSVSKAPVLNEWTERARRCDMLHKTVKIAMVGKYTGLSDSHLSVLMALLHASVACERELVVNWVPASDLEEATKAENSVGYRTAWNLLKGADGVLVPGGFGDRGLEGELLAAKYARENKIPYLGVRFGIQTAVLEFAHSVLGVCDASSTEFDKDGKSQYVIFMPEGSKTHMGGTMQLGSRRTFFHVCDCTSAKLPLQKMLGTDLLSSTDAKRLQELGVVFESTTESGFLSVQAEGSKFDLIHRTDSSIPDGSITPLTSHSEIVRAVLEPKRNKYAEKYRVNKLSLALSDYLLPLDEGDDQIEIRSPVPVFPPAGQLTVVSSNDKRKKVGEYCLAACEDGIVRWLHESECVNKRNHVWTVHWFDLRGGGGVYFGDRLQRFVRDVHNYFISTYIGGNVNGSGTQNIGTVNTGTQNIGTVNTLRAIAMHRFLLGICLLYLIGSSIVGKSLSYFLFLASKHVRRNFE